MAQEIEDRLLLYSLGIVTEEVMFAEFENLSDADWDQVIKRSVVHRVTPLLYYRLKTANIDSRVPPGVMQKLQEIYFNSSWKNTRLYHRLSKVLEILRREDIPVIVLKGAALAKLIYQNYALRPMLDVDLLVKARDMWNVYSLLSKSGYKSDAGSLLYSKRHARWVRHITYWSDDTSYPIQFHPRIPEIPNLDPWVNACPAEIASIDTLVLGSEDFLLHLCVHLDSHICLGDTSLIRWYDVLEVLGHCREDIDWDYVIRVAKEHGVEESIHRILRAVNHCFDRHIVPSDVLGQFKDNSAAISINDILRLAPPRKPTGEQENRGFNISYISQFPSVYSKIYHVFRATFPRREFMINCYSIARPGRVYPYYFIRIGQLAAKALRTLYNLPGYLTTKHTPAEHETES